MSNRTKGFFAAVVCLTFAIGPALAQNGEQDEPRTEKLWRIETSGIGG